MDIKAGDKFKFIEGKESPVVSILFVDSKSVVYESTTGFRALVKLNDFKYWYKKEPETHEAFLVLFDDGDISDPFLTQEELEKWEEDMKHLHIKGYQIKRIEWQPKGER